MSIKAVSVGKGSPLPAPCRTAQPCRQILQHSSFTTSSCIGLVCGRRDGTHLRPCPRPAPTAPAPRGCSMRRFQLVRFSRRVFFGSAHSTVGVTRASILPTCWRLARGLAPSRQSDLRLELADLLVGGRAASPLLVSPGGAAIPQKDGAQDGGGLSSSLSIRRTSASRAQAGHASNRRTPGQPLFPHNFG